MGSGDIGSGAIEVIPTGAAVGAEIRGINLAEPQPGETVFEVLQAFREHMILIFRGQELTHDQLLDVAQWFGPYNVPPKGIPLPCISYGGTALLVALFSVGVLMNIALAVQAPVISARAGCA